MRRIKYADVQMKRMNVQMRGCADVQIEYELNNSRYAAKCAVNLHIRTFAYLHINKQCTK
jgi:hypothetical protein